MKHTTRHSNRFDRHHGHVGRAATPDRPASTFPPPDPATRVSLQPPTTAVHAIARSKSSGRDVVMAVGIGGTATAIASAAVQVANFPWQYEVGVAAVGVLLAVMGAVAWTRRRSGTSRAAVDVQLPQTEADLPLLTGQIGALLTELRHEHGLAYRSRTWIDDVLPEFGGPLPHPLLARDLLAVAALDAGGIRANVAGLARDHERGEVVTAAQALQSALQSVLDACEGSSDLPTPPTPDQSCWPVLAH